MNWYAATEVGVIGRSVLARDADLPAGRIGAGVPITSRAVSIVDAAGVPITDGSVGEVIVTGGPIADGYLGRASARFLADDRVDEAFVTAITTDGRIDLVAYVSGAVTAETDVTASVRSSLRAALPEWMVPRFVVGLGALPRTERGKLDRAALPDPTPSVAGKKRRSSSDIVESVARFAVTQAMGTDDIDADADLIALGADSLALARISTTVRQRINGDIDFAAFSVDPTIATLAAGIRDHYRNGGGLREGNGVLVPLREGAGTATGAGRPLVVVAGAGGPASSLLAMARHMAPGRPVYGLQAIGLERTGRPDRSVAAMARRYVDLITTVQPHGPYLLAGHSMGGIVAL